MGQIFEDFVAQQAAKGVDVERAPSTIAGPAGLPGAEQQVYEAQPGRLDLSGVLRPGAQLPSDMTPTYQQWYTGRNLEGPANGWNTEFMQVAQQQYVQAQERGDVLTMFERPDAVGVVTWDGAKDSKGTTLQFGDVVADGVKVGHVYDDVDEHTGNVMMGEWTIQDGARKARLNAATDYEGAWSGEMKRLRRENTELVERAGRAEEFSEDVTERADEEIVPFIVAAGAGGGAAVGAGIGSIVPLIGTAVGAVAGAVVGGVGAFLNQDALAYSIAREREKLDLIAEQEGMGAAYAGELAGSLASTFTQTALSPLSNLSQGVYDATRQGGLSSTDFDAASGGAFYNVDEEGQRTAGMQWQIASHVAMVGDAIGQFGNPLARGMYLTQMSMNVGGGAAGLVPGVGQWDDRNLRVDSIYTDNEGNPDLSAAAAGIVYVGVEAVQLGGMKGLFSSLTRKGGTARDTGNVWNRWNLSKDQKQALADGGQLQQLSGWKFVTDDKGALVGKGKTSLAMLAPSEALQAVGARSWAARAAAQSKGAIQSERLYQAAFDLSVGTRRSTTALVNAFGEAQEEGLQAFLEPLKHGHAVDPEEIYRAAAAGFASGLGMGIVAGAGRAKADEQMYAQANVYNMLRTGQEISREQWAGMQELQKRSLVNASIFEESVARAGFDKMAANMTAAIQGGVVEAKAVMDWWRKASTKALERGTTATDASHTIVMLDDSRFRSDAVASSANQLAVDQANKTLGIQTQIENAGQELDRLRTQGAADTDQRVQELTAQRDQMTRMAKFSGRIEAYARQLSDEIDTILDSGAADADDQAATLIDTANRYLVDLYDPQYGRTTVQGFGDLSLADQLILSKAVARVSTRHPEDSSASFQSFVPQIDYFFTKTKADGAFAVSAMTNKAMRSDYDGDKVHHLGQLMLDDKEYIDLRSGVNLLGQSMTPEITTTDGEIYILGQIRDIMETGTTTHQSLVADVATKVENQLRRWYPPGVVSEANLDVVVTNMRRNLEAGRDVREMLLTDLSAFAGGDLVQVGRGEKRGGGSNAIYSNEFYNVARMVTLELDKFQSRWSQVKPRPGEPTPMTASPSRLSADAYARRVDEAATPGAWITEVLPGESLFRMFQSLHYSLFTSNEAYVGWSTEARATGVAEMVQFYEKLANNAVEILADRMPHVDEIAGTALGMLTRLAKNPAAIEAMGLTGKLTELDSVAKIANLSTARYQYRINPDTKKQEKYFDGSRVSLGQQVLYEAAEQYRRKYSDVIESDAEVASVYNKVLSMTAPPGGRGNHAGNAERAFVHLFETVPMYDLVGEASASLGVTLTVGQFYRQQLDVDADSRSEAHAALATMPEYRGRSETTAPVTAPYGMDAIREGQITTFRTLVDSVFSAASSDISTTRSGATKGEVTGRFKSRSDTTHAKIAEVISAVRNQILRETRATKVTPEMVRDYINQNEDQGLALFGVVPDKAMASVYLGQDAAGRPMMAKWFYEVFATENVEHAVMKLWWNLHRSSWQAMEAGFDLDGDGRATDYGVEAHRIESRFERVMYKAASAGFAESFRYQELLSRAENATNLQDFLDWVNNESGLIQLQSPLLAWVDDTSDFDPIKSGSGWSDAKTMPQIMEQMDVLLRLMKQQQGEHDTKVARRASNTNLLGSIRRALAEEQGTLSRGVTVDDTDRLHRRQFRKAIERAKGRDLVHGPRSTVVTAALLAYGVSGPGHNKGSNQEFLAAQEMYDAVIGAMGYTTNLERLAADITTHDEDSVAGSPEQIVNNGGRLMVGDDVDNAGAVSEWDMDQLDEAEQQLLTLMEADIDRTDLVVAMLAPQSIELASDNRPRRQTIYGNDLQDLLTSTSQARLYNPDGRPSLEQSVKYLADLEAKERAKGHDFSVTQLITELTIASTSGLTEPASVETMMSLATQAVLDWAHLLQEAGRTTVGTDGVDPAHEVWKSLVKVRSQEAAEGVLGYEVFEDFEPDEYRRWSKLQLADRYDSEDAILSDRLTAELSKDVQDPVAIQDLVDRREALQNALWSEQQNLDDLLDGTVLERIVSTYQYTEDMPDIEKDLRKSVILEYLELNSHVLSGASETLPIMQKVFTYFHDRVHDPLTATLNLEDSEWNALSRRIISLDLQARVSTGVPGNAPPSYPDTSTAEGAHAARFMDYTFSYLADFLAPDNTSGLLASAREMAVESEQTAVPRTPEQLVNVLDSTLYRPNRLGQWTAAIPVVSQDAYNVINGAGGVPSIAMHGLLTRRHSAVASATRRSFAIPNVDLASDVRLRWQDLNYSDATNGPTNPMKRLVSMEMPDGNTTQRPLIQLNNRFAIELEVHYQDATGARQMVSLLNDSSVTAPYMGMEAVPTADQAEAREMRVVNIDRLRDRLERIAIEASGGDKGVTETILAGMTVDMAFFHPESQPATPEFYNNLWFEGVVFDSVGDVSESLLYSLWFGGGGVNATGQQAALDTRKKGLAGIEAYQHVDWYKVKAIESQFDRDFAGMLTAKVDLIMNANLGQTGMLDDSFYNAIYKWMRVKHFVDGTVDGNSVRLTAEEVVAGQRANGPGIWDADGNEVQDAKLWIPSDQVLAQSMGEIGYGGVPSMMPETRQTVTDLSSIPDYQGWNSLSDRVLERFAPAKPGVNLLDTRVAQTLRLSDPIVSLDIDDKLRAKIRQDRELFDIRRKQVTAERAGMQQKGFDAKRNLKRAADKAREWLENEDITMVIPSAPWMQMPQREPSARYIAALNDYIAEATAETGRAVTGHVLTFDGGSNPYRGELNHLDLSRSDVPRMPGDLVIADASSYSEAATLSAEEAAKTIRAAGDMLAAQNLAVVATASSGASSLTAQLAHQMLSKHGYVRYKGNPRILVPPALSEHEFRNARAVESSLLAESPVTVRQQKILGLLKGANVTENTLLVPTHRRSGLEKHQRGRTLLPSHVSSYFGVPTTADELNKVLATLENIKQNGMLQRLAERDDRSPEQQAEFIKAFDELMLRLPNRIANNTTLPVAGEENWGTGDLIPYLSPNGEIFLSQYGHQFPYEDHDAQLLDNIPTRQGPGRILVSKKTVEPNATTYKGRVLGVEPRPNFGHSIHLEVDSGPLVLKLVVEIDGMKWLTAPLGDQLTEPNAPLMGNNVWVDGYGLLQNPIDKDGSSGFVTSFRNGFALFGVDLLPEVADFFGVTPTDAMTILRALESQPDKKSPREIKRLQDLSFGNVPELAALNALTPRLQNLQADPSWRDRLTEDSAQAHIVKALMLYLSSEGARLDSVLYSSGLDTVDRLSPTAMSRRMPELFTRYFDAMPMGSPTRTFFFDKFQDRLGQTGNEGWHIAQDWTVTGTNGLGERTEMILMFGEMHVSDDNTKYNVAAQERRHKQGTSYHSSLVTTFGVGGDMFPSRDSGALQRIDDILGKDYQEEIDKSEAWRIMANLRSKKSSQRAVDAQGTFGPGSRWQNMNQAEYVWTRDFSMPKVKSYRARINLDQEDLKERKSELETSVKVLARELGLEDGQEHVVHYLLRQFLWRPIAQPGQKNFDDSFNAEELLTSLDAMTKDVRKGLSPLHQAPGPQMLHQADLNLLRVMAKRNGRFKPRAVEGDPSSVLNPDDEGQWISWAFGSALAKEQDIDPAYATDLDGFLMTYYWKLKSQGRFMDVTFDKELQGKLLDPQTNELLAVSLDADRRTLLRDAVVRPDGSISGMNVYAGQTLNEDPLAADAYFVSHSRRRIAGWRRKNKIRPEARGSARDFVKYGSRVIDNHSETHSLSRILISLRHITTMLVPGLYISMVPEQGFRTYLNGAANLISGELTGKRTGELTARMKLNKYDPETIGELNRLYDDIAAGKELPSEIIKDFAYLDPNRQGGKITRGIERGAAFVNSWQDPTWGMPQRILAQHYVEAVLRMVQESQISQVMTVEAAIAALKQDHLYFAKHHKDIHQRASNFVVDFRGLKQTPWSLAIRAMYEPFTRSGSATLQFGGLLLKLPAMYANFNMNMLTTITGMQGYTNLLAAFIDGRQTPGTLFSRMRKKQLDEQDDIRYDMSSVLDGYTIANSFIRGGVSQTGLFTLGMLAGGLLSGEDDEAKRRRRLAEAQNVPFVADPRRLEADFRNKDMVFLDWLPDPFKSALQIVPGAENEGGRSGVQISWLMKPFLSPIMGMEKFFMTGDFGWVTYGFYDAVGSLPLVNKSLWDDAVRTADELAHLAADQQAVGTPESTRNSMWLLTSAVAYYERMLLENMFINSLYSGFDPYDRDPTKIPLRDSDGQPQFLGTGQPRENDQVLERFVNEDGEVDQGYATRDEASRMAAYYTENNATAAVLLSLMTGFQQDLGRYSMPVKIRDIEIPALTSDEAKILVSTALQQEWAKSGNVPQTLSLQEITKQIGSAAAEAGNWDVYNNVDAIAAQVYETQNSDWNPMSALNVDGVEELTNLGVARLLDGVRKGSIGLDHPAMRNISISYETRQQIQDDFLADVMQEGVDLGLTNTQAYYRAERLLTGPRDDSSVVGFADILWDFDSIPASSTAKYSQLNTTYVSGPDGFPWATGFRRGGAIQQLGGWKRMTLGPENQILPDSRANAIDLTRGINTGLRALQPFDSSNEIPTDVEMHNEVMKSLKKLEEKVGDFTPNDTKNNKGSFYNGGGYRRFPRSSYGGYRRFSSGGGGGGYRSSSPTIYFSRMPYLYGGTNVYGDDVRNIFWDNALIRRNTIRRERYSSQRGRLNQWQ